MPATLNAERLLENAPAATGLRKMHNRIHRDFLSSVRKEESQESRGRGQKRERINKIENTNKK